MELRVFTLAPRRAVRNTAIGEFLSASTLIIISTDVNNDAAAIVSKIIVVTDVKRAMVVASAQAAVTLRCELCLDD